jgi:hypothetical protein
MNSIYCVYTRECPFEDALFYVKEGNISLLVEISRLKGGERMIFTDEKKQQIAETLTQKGANRPCERCGSRDFTVLDGYFRQEVQDDLKNVNLGGPSIPTFALACGNCGNLSFFAAKVVSPNEF